MNSIAAGAAVNALSSIQNIFEFRVSVKHLHVLLVNCNTLNSVWVRLHDSPQCRPH